MSLRVTSPPGTNTVTLGDSTLSLRATLSAQPNYRQSAEPEGWSLLAWPNTRQSAEPRVTLSAQPNTIPTLPPIPGASLAGSPAARSHRSESTRSFTRDSPAQTLLPNDWQTRSKEAARPKEPRPASAFPGPELPGPAGTREHPPSPPVHARQAAEPITSTSPTAKSYADKVWWAKLRARFSKVSLDFEARSSQPH